MNESFSLALFKKDDRFKAFLGFTVNSSRLLRNLSLFYLSSPPNSGNSVSGQSVNRLNISGSVSGGSSSYIYNITTASSASKERGY